MSKKIVFVLSNKRNSFGGMERVISELSEYFYNHGVNLTFIFLDKKFSYKCSGDLIELETNISKNLLGKLINVFKRCYKLNKILKSNKYDIIVSTYWLAPFILFFYRKRMVSSYHSNPFYFSKLYQFFLKKTFKIVNRVIVPSSIIADTIFKKWKLNNVIAIPNPINFDYIAKKSIERESSSVNCPYILAAGRLEPEKNFELLINAYCLSKASNSTCLLILGDGSLKESLESLIREKKIENKVLLLGRHDNPFFYMKNSLFVVISSNTEVFSMTGFEALACEVPIISTKWYGYEVLLRDRLNGLLVEKNNPIQLSGAIDELFFDSHLRQALKKNTKVSVANLAIEEIGQRYSKIFDEIYFSNS